MRPSRPLWVTLLVGWRFHRPTTVTVPGKRFPMAVPPNHPVIMDDHFSIETYGFEDPASHQISYIQSSDPSSQVNSWCMLLPGVWPKTRGPLNRFMVRPWDEKGDESPACLAEESAWELGWEEGWNWCFVPSRGFIHNISYWSHLQLGTYLFGLQSLPATCIGSGATVFAPEPFAPCVAPWSCLRNKRKVMLRLLPGMVPIEHGGDTVRKWVGLLVRQKPRKDAIQLANWLAVWLEVHDC